MKKLSVFSLVSVGQFFFSALLMTSNARAAWPFHFSQEALRSEVGPSNETVPPNKQVMIFITAHVTTGDIEAISAKQFENMVAAMRKKYPERRILSFKNVEDLESNPIRLNEGEFITHFYLDHNAYMHLPKPPENEYSSRPHYSFSLSLDTKDFSYPDIRNASGAEVSELNDSIIDRDKIHPLDSIRGRFTRNAKILINSENHRENPEHLTMFGELYRAMLGVKTGHLYLTQPRVTLKNRAATKIPIAAGTVTAMVTTPAYMFAFWGADLATDRLFEFLPPRLSGEFVIADEKVIEMDKRDGHTALREFKGRPRNRGLEFKPKPAKR